MKARITKIVTNQYFDSDEPGTEIRIWAALDTPLKRPEERFKEADEVTTVEFNIYSDEEHVFKPLRPGTVWLQPWGYRITKRGTRNKTTGYGRLRSRDLSASEEAAIILSLLKDPRLPEALRGAEEVAA